MRAARAVVAPPQSLASKLADGSFASNAEQESERLNEHLVALSCGDHVDTLVEPPAPATPATHNGNTALAATGSLPDEVQRVITDLPNNKALGMDQIPAELWKAGHELASLLDWTLRTGNVPAAWRGGRSARLNEGKGPTESTDSHRGLLIGDHTDKVYTGVLSPEVKKAVEQFLPPQQCSKTRCKTR